MSGGKPPHMCKVFHTPFLLGALKSRVKMYIYLDIHVVKKKTHVIENCQSYMTVAEVS